MAIKMRGTSAAISTAVDEASRSDHMDKRPGMSRRNKEKEGLVGEKRIHPGVSETFRGIESLDSDEIANVGNAAFRDALES